MTDLTVLEQYISDAVQTSSTLARVDVQRGRYADDYTHIIGPESELLHAALGLSTETGELLDAWKKIIAYGRPPDFVNMDEEVGDINWYVALYWYNRAKMDYFGSEHEHLCRIAAQLWSASLTRNIAKLAKRYPDKYFTLAHTEQRDLLAEREVLEGKG